VKLTPMATASLMVQRYLSRSYRSRNNCLITAWISILAYASSSRGR
jgi:hypothetical protein